MKSFALTMGSARAGIMTSRIAQSSRLLLNNLKRVSITSRIWFQDTKACFAKNKVGSCSNLFHESLKFSDCMTKNWAYSGEEVMRDNTATTPYMCALRCSLDRRCDVWNFNQTYCFFFTCYGEPCVSINLHPYIHTQTNESVLRKLQILTQEEKFLRTDHPSYCGLDKKCPFKYSGDILQSYACLWNIVEIMSQTVPFQV